MRVKSIHRLWIKPLAAFLLLAGCLAASAAPEIEFFDAANISLPTLAIPVGVRAIAMGNAYTAAGNDAYALNWNPAGLTRQDGFQLGLAHNEWSTELGMRQELFSYGQDLGQDSGMGLSLNYMGLGKLDQRDAAGGLQGRSDASAFSASAGYGWSLLRQHRLKLGLALEFGMESLYGTSDSGFGGTLGLLYDFTKDTSAGVSINHLGSGAKGFNLPQALNVGLASLFFNRNLTLALDADVPLNSPTMLNAGLEYNISVVSLRAGYRSAMGGPQGQVDGGLTAGLGFKAGLLRLDYAYVPYGGITTAHRLQATVELPGDFFEAKIVGPEGTSTTAESFYNNAMKLEKSGETLRALIQYQRCEEAYPESMKKKNPQAFYLTAKKKVVELQADMQKGGDHGQIQKLIREHLMAAEADIKAGKPKEAMVELQEAKLIDPSNPAIERLIKDAQKGLEDRLSVYRKAAQFASSEDNLSMATENYRKLLAVDASDMEALTYFTKHRREIKAMLQAVSRKGIFFYVAGNVDEAIKAWSEGQALDYFGDIDFKRDLDKARRQQEVRGN